MRKRTRERPGREGGKGEGHKKIEILKESRKVKQEILRLNTKKLELSYKEDFVQKKIDLDKKNLLIIFL